MVQKIFLLICIPVFRLEKVVATADQEILECFTFSVISDSSASFSPGRYQAISEMSPRYLVFGWPLGRFPMGVTSRTFLVKPSLGILECDQNLPGRFGEVSRTNTAEISLDNRSYIHLTPAHFFAVSRRKLRKNLICDTCSRENILTVMTHWVWPKIYYHMWGSEQRVLGLQPPIGVLGGNRPMVAVVLDGDCPWWQLSRSGYRNKDRFKTHSLVWFESSLWRPEDSATCKQMVTGRWRPQVTSPCDSHHEFIPT